MGQQPAKITKQWADGPFQLLETPRKRLGSKQSISGAMAAGSEMALVHNVIIRILNCIYLQAPNVKLDKDIEDFTTFMYAWTVLIHEHHGNEEKFFFPWLEEDIGVAGYMEKNIEQHHAFAPGMKRFDEYVTALRAGTEKFDGAKVRSIIDDFGEILALHLKEEIEAFEELERFGDKIDWKRWNKRVEETAVGTAEKDHELPICITNMDATFEAPIHDPFWPPFPWFVGLMFRWVYIPRHKGAWRFSCCDTHSMPKELEFV